MKGLFNVGQTCNSANNESTHSANRGDGTHLNISWGLIYTISLRFTIIFEKLAPGYMTLFPVYFVQKAKERKRSLSDSPSRSSTIKEPSHWNQMTLLLARTTALEKETGLNDLLDASAI